MTVVSASSTPFSLEMLGGGWEKRYRRTRPEGDRLAWGTLPDHDAPTRACARDHWTIAAYQEHATAAICGEMLRLLVCCRAPLDLIACASRFPLDELVHVELCARLLSELGGAAALEHDPELIAPRADPALPLVLAMLELAVRVFCVGEAVSVPIIAATWRATVHPLPRGILQLILRDEATHGTFGFAVLDWAADRITPAWRAHLTTVARETIDELRTSWAVLDRKPETGLGAQLGWLEPPRYLEVAHAALSSAVIGPLRARGILVS